MRAANRSAVTTPLTRMVFSKSPVAMVTVRSVAISGFAAPPAPCLAIKASPASTATAAVASSTVRGADPLVK